MVFVGEKKMGWETENIFDFLYNFILFTDMIGETKKIDRELYINWYIQMMNHVHMCDMKSPFYHEFHHAKTISKFFKLIIKPRFNI